MKRVITILTLTLFAISLLTTLSYAAKSPPAGDSQRDANTVTSPQDRISSPDIENKSGFFERLFTKVVILKNPFGSISIIAVDDPPDGPLNVRTPPGERDKTLGPDLDEDPWAEDK